MYCKVARCGGQRVIKRGSKVGSHLMCVQLMSDSPQMWAMWLVKQAEDSHSGKMLFMFCALTKRYW